MAQGQFRNEPPKAVKPEVVDSAPILYADSLVHLAIGPFVSKLTFGNQNPAQHDISAVATLTIPSNALLDLARNVIAAFGTPAVMEKLEGDFAKMRKRAADINVTVRSS